MTDGLRYPSLRCILEHMEANKRIYLAFRCPRLFQIEKSIPLRITNLIFEHNSLRINNLKYSLRESGEQYEINQEQMNTHLATLELAPGDVQIEPEPVFRNFVEIWFMNRESDVSIVRRLPAHLEIPKAMKMLTTFLLGGRKSIKVVNSLGLDIRQGGVIRLPEGLKIWTRTLYTYRSNFKSFLFLVDPSCYPLKLLVTKVTDPKDFEHPVFCTAKQVLLGMIYETRQNADAWMVAPWIPELQKHTHVSIHLRGYNFPIESLIGLIRNWMEYGREVGTLYSYDGQLYSEVVKIMNRILAEFGGWYKKMVGSEEGSPYLSYYLSIPFNDTSELNIYAALDPCIPGYYILELEIEPIKSLDSLPMDYELFHYSTVMCSDPHYLLIFLICVLFFVTNVWFRILYPDFIFIPWECWKCLRAS